MALTLHTSGLAWRYSYLVTFTTSLSLFHSGDKDLLRPHGRLLFKKPISLGMLLVFHPSATFEI